MEFVMPLRDLDREDLAIAGGKGANLGELVRAGLQVPAGFVVTTDAYARVVDLLDLKVADRVAGGDGVAIRASVEAAAMPAEHPGGHCRCLCCAQRWTSRCTLQRHRRGFARGDVRRPAGHVPQPHRRSGRARRCAEMLGLIVDRPRNRIPRSDRCRTGSCQDRGRRPAHDQRRDRGRHVHRRSSQRLTKDRLVDASIGSGLRPLSPAWLLLITMCWTTNAGNVRDFQQGRREVVIPGAAAGGVVREAEALEQCPEVVRQCACRAGAAWDDGCQTLWAPARHRVGLRRRTGVAVAGTAHDSAPAATAQAQRSATSARVGPSRLRAGPPVPNRHEHLGAARSGRADGQESSGLSACATRSRGSCLRMSTGWSIGSFP